MIIATKIPTVIQIWKVMEVHSKPVIFPSQTRFLLEQSIFKSKNMKYSHFEKLMISYENIKKYLITYIKIIFDNYINI